MVSAKAYVIRSKLTAVREQTVTQLVDKLQASFGIETEFINEYDTDDIDVEKIKSFVDLNKSDKSEFFDALVRNMHIRSVSNAMKHYTALQKAMSVEADYIMVFEDDVLFGDQMDVKVKQVLEKKDHTWDICFVGLPSVSPIKDHEVITYDAVKNAFRVLPSCEAYIIRKSSLAKIFEGFLPILFPTNIHYSFLSEIMPLEISYIVPNLFVDGSKMGIYLSSIESNNRLYMNPEYNQISQLVRREQPLNESERADVAQLFERIRFKNHPDIQVLQGLYYEKIGEFEKARDLYKEAHSVHQQNGCIINNESEILARLVNIQKYFQ